MVRSASGNPGTGGWAYPAEPVGPAGQGGGSMYRLCSVTWVPTWLRRRVKYRASEMARTTMPPSIKITPMAWMFTYFGVQVIANRRIAPMMMSAMLPPMVTGPPLVSRTTPAHGAGLGERPSRHRHPPSRGSSVHRHPGAPHRPGSLPVRDQGYRHSPGRFWHPGWPPVTQWSLASPFVGGHGDGVARILGCVDPLAPLRSVGGRLAPPMKALAQSIAERVIGL